MGINPELMREGAESAVKLMKALAHEGRLMVLCALLEGERSVGDLEQLTGLSQSALSQHLAKLREDGFAQTRREGQAIFYRLADAGPKHVIEVLHDLYCPQPA